MKPIYGFVVIARLSLALLIPGSTEADMIDDNYIGANDHGYGMEIPFWCRHPIPRVD